MFILLLLFFLQCTMYSSLVCELFSGFLLAWYFCLPYQHKYQIFAVYFFASFNCVNYHIMHITPFYFITTCNCKI